MSGGVDEKSLTSETVEECGVYGPRASSPVQRMSCGDIKI